MIPSQKAFPILIVKDTNCVRSQGIPQPYSPTGLFPVPMRITNRDGYSIVTTQEPYRQHLKKENRSRHSKLIRARSRDDCPERRQRATAPADLRLLIALPRSDRRCILRRA